MPPKFKFTKSEIVNASLDIIRENGPDCVSARNIAAKLSSSPKVIFSWFNSMEDLWHEIMKTTEELYNSYIVSDMAKNEYPKYKASGMAYIRFASEEKELFKLLFMRDRTNEIFTDDDDSIEPLLRLIMQKSGLSFDEAKLFHLEMWVWVHGIASMVATGYLNLDIKLISEMLSDVYNGTMMRFKEKKSNEHD